MALAMQGGSELRRPCCLSGYLIANRTKGMPKRARARSSKRNKQGHRVTLSYCNGPGPGFPDYPLKLRRNDQRYLPRQRLGQEP